MALSGQSEIGATLMALARACPYKFKLKFQTPPWDSWEIVPAPRNDPAKRRWIGRPKGRYNPRQDDRAPERVSFIGSMVHEGFAAWMQGQDYREAVESLCAPHGGIGGGLFSSGIPQSWVSSALETLERVVGIDPLPRSDWEFLAAETSLWGFVGSGPDKRPMNQRADLIIRNRKTGKVWVLDWKNTSSQEKGRDPSLWAISPQFQGFSELGRENYGDKFGGVIVGHIDVTRDRDFRGFELHPLVAPTIENFRLTTQNAEAIKEISQSGEGRRAYMEEVCRPYGRPCEFWYNCYGLTYTPSAV